MARTSSYRKETLNQLNANDLFTVSSYEGTINDIPNYITRNISLDDLSDYINSTFSVDGINYDLQSINNDISGLTSSVATINSTLITQANSISANASYSLNLASSFGTFSSSGNLETLSQSFANTVMTTTNNSRFAESTFVNNLGSSFGTVAANGAVTISEAFADSVITTTASTRFATTTSVNTLTSTVSGKPDIFRQAAEPLTTNAVGSIWYDTDDNNKVYVLVAGSPNVWTLTSDDRIVTNSNSISTVNQSVTTLNNTLTAEAALIDELQTQFTFDTSGGITGTADALNTSISTAQSNAESASASKVDTLASKFFTGYNNSTGGFTAVNVSEAFANEIFDTTTSTNFASSSSLTTLSARVDTAETDIGNNETNIAAKPSVFRQDAEPSTTGVADKSLWYDTDDNNKLYVLNSGTWTATFDGRIGTNASNISTNTSNITANVTALGLRPKVFRQNAEPSTSGVPANSLWYDTDDNNKLYIYNGSSWVLTDDSRIGNNTTSIANANTSITANADAITARTSRIEELESQFTFDNNDSITGVADALSTSISTTATSAAGSVASDLDKLEAVFSFDSNNNVDGIQGALSSAVTTNANTAISNASLASASDVNELKSQFTFDSNNNITGVADALSTSISNTASSEAGAVATDLDKLEAVFSFDSNGDVDGIQGSLSTAVTSNANTAISNASLASAADVTELKTQFTFDSNGAITGVADTLNTTINTAQSDAESAAASKVDTLASQFFTGYNNSNGNYTAMTEAFANTVFTTTTNTDFASSSSVTTLSATVDTKPDTFRQASQPAVTGAAGSLWYDTDDGNKLYVLVAGTPKVWTATVDASIATAQQAANTAQSTANARPKTFNQTSAPAVTEPVGSIWFDTDDGNKSYILVSGSPNVWTNVQDSGISSATQAAAAAQSTADSRPKTFYTNGTAPAVTEPVGSIWYDSSSNNKPYILESGSPNVWTEVRDGNILAAQQAANAAQNTADSRPKVFRQTSAPATTEPEYSLWYDTDDDNKIYVLVGGTWTSTADARIDVNSSAIATVEGYAESRFSLKATAGNVVTGMSILAADGTTTDVSEIKFQADKFIVNSSSTNLTPFSISGGRINIDGDLVVTNGSATISGSNGSGDFIAALFKNTNAVSGNTAATGIEMRSSSDYHHIIKINGTGGTPGGLGSFDLSASYRLGRSNAGNNNYSTEIIKLNGAGLIIPSGTTQNHSDGMNIILNDDDGARTVNSGRLHVNGYYKTLFLDVPAATGSSGTYQNDMFAMRKWMTSSGGFERTVFKIDTNDHVHIRGTLYALLSTNHYLDMDNTGDSLKVAGDVVAYVSSDKRYKDNIVNISNPLDKLNKINGVSFTWNKISHKETGKKDIGVIAQEIEEVLPEIVETRDNGYKAVDYPKLTALLIESIKELNNKVKKLEDELTK